MLNVVVIIVSRMTSHCAGTVQVREESESASVALHTALYKSEYYYCY